MNVQYYDRQTVTSRVTNMMAIYASKWYVDLRATLWCWQYVWSLKFWARTTAPVCCKHRSITSRNKYKNSFHQQPKQPWRHLNLELPFEANFTSLVVSKSSRRSRKRWNRWRCTRQQDSTSSPQASLSDYLSSKQSPLHCQWLLYERTKCNKCRVIDSENVSFPTSTCSWPLEIGLTEIVPQTISPELILRIEVIGLQIPSQSRHERCLATWLSGSVTWSWRCHRTSNPRPPFSIS